MKIDVTRNEQAVTLALEGWLDVQSAAEFGAVVETLGSFESITLDFAKVDYISSAGIRQIIALYRQVTEKKATIAIIHVCPNVMEVFRMTGLDRRLPLSE